MPYPFVLPTTSAFSFSSSIASDSHPSLPLRASTQRGVVRDTLKKHKRLPPAQQAAHLASVAASLDDYLPYLFAVVDANTNANASTSPGAERIHIAVRAPPLIEWRPTVSSSSSSSHFSPSSSAAAGVARRGPPRVRVHSLEHETAFVLATLAATRTLQARAALHPLYVTSTAPVGTQERQAAVTGATRHLLDAAGLFAYLGSRSSSSASSSAQTQPQPPLPSADIAPATLRALESLAVAEATLLAVLKDDPYPAVVAADRNRHDTEWMYKAPDIPKVRAHLFARLCLTAAEHAARAHALCAAVSGRGGGSGSGGGSNGAGGGGGVSEGLIKYLEDLRRTSRAKACRFFGVDAELGGQTGTAIAWLYAGLQELGIEPPKGGSGGGGKKGGGSGSSGGGGGGGLGRLRKEWSERREDRRVEKDGNWGADAGRLEETRVIEMLEAKWTKQNDTMFTQLIPPTGPLLAQMPSGREIHTVKPFQPPRLDAAVLEAMRAPPPPNRTDDTVDGGANDMSSDEETLVDGGPVGAFPGTHGEYRTGTPNYY